jgi:hypothetical protein
MTFTMVFDGVEVEATDTIRDLNHSGFFSGTTASWSLANDQRIHLPSALSFLVALPGTRNPPGRVNISDFTWPTAEDGGGQASITADVGSSLASLFIPAIFRAATFATGTVAYINADSTVLGGYGFANVSPTAVTIAGDTATLTFGATDLTWTMGGLPPTPPPPPPPPGGFMTAGSGG